MNCNERENAFLAPDSRARHACSNLHFPTVRVRSKSQIGLSILRSFLVLLTIHICMPLNIREKIPRCLHSYFSTEYLKPDHKTAVLSQSSKSSSIKCCGYEDICWAFGAFFVLLYTVTPA